MDQKSLYDFYEKVLLPQFGISNKKVKWLKSERAGEDEFVHYFSIGSDSYAVIFVDFGNLGTDEEFIKGHVELKRDDFEFVKPTSESDCAPSYPIAFPTPYKYCENVTGIFTLLRI